MRPRDLQLARRAKKHGAHYSLRIVLEARRAGIPISLAFALVEQESGFRNVFGHDAFGLYKGLPVTKSRVHSMLDHITKGGTSNGVGLTQLTWPGYIRQAVGLGGAHIPKNQLRVGFKVLKTCIDEYGLAGGLAAYNAGHPGSTQGSRYASSVLRKQKWWHRVLTGQKVSG